MRRVCCQCQKVYGEKCPECGKEATVLNEHSAYCPPCALKFVVGTGPNTHGYCDECLEKEKR